MTPALSHPTPSHAYSSQPLSNVSTTQPADGAVLYAQIQPQLAEQAISDRRLMRFQNEASQVFPQHLLPLPERFGLPEIGELTQSGLTHASVANATVLPSDGLPGTSMTLGIPGNDLDKAGTAERVARFGAALLSKQVAHVVCANHTDTLVKAQVPFGQEVALRSQGGPLNIAFSQAKLDDTGVPHFHIKAKLPSGLDERSDDIAVWNINFATPNIEDIRTTLRALYVQSEGQDVAFCCQSGSSRSGAAALLFHQRKAAEEAFKRGEVPKGADLVATARAWEDNCKAVRGSAFAAKITESLLKQHAQALVEEMNDRLASQANQASRASQAGKPKPPPPILTPKPILPILPVKPTPNSERHHEAAHQATPETTKRQGVPPDIAAKPTAKPQPMPRPRNKSVDTESVRSDASEASSDAGAVASVATVESADSGGEAFNRLRDKPKPTLVPVRSYAYNAPIGEGKPLADIPVAPANDRLPDVQEGTRVNTFEGIYAEVEEPGAEYSVPWAPPNFTGMGSRQPDAAVTLRQSFRHLASMTRGMSLHLQGGSRAPENHYSVAMEVPPAMPAVHKSLADWQTGTHIQTKDLERYVHGLAQTFTQEAKQGLRLFAAKNSYGVGKVINAVKSEAAHDMWIDLAKDLQATLDQATATQLDMTNDVLVSVMKQGLQKEFDRLGPKMQETWLRRTGKSELNEAIVNLKGQVQSIQKELERSQTPAPDLPSRLQKLTLTLMSFHALFLVGNDPTRV